MSGVQKDAPGDTLESSQRHSEGNEEAKVG